MSERSEANDRVLFEILLCIYIDIYIIIYMLVRNANGDGRNGQTTQAGAAVAQALMMAAPCGIYLCSRTARSSVSSALRRFVRRRSAASRLDFAIAGTLPPTLCCALVQCALTSC